MQNQRSPAVHNSAQALESTPRPQEDALSFLLDFQTQEHGHLRSPVRQGCCEARHGPGRGSWCVPSRSRNHAAFADRGHREVPCCLSILCILASCHDVAGSFLLPLCEGCTANHRSATPCCANAVGLTSDPKHGGYQKVPSQPRAAAAAHLSGGRRLMLLVHVRARDTDLNKAIRRLRIKGAHELLVRAQTLRAVLGFGREHQHISSCDPLQALHARQARCRCMHYLLHMPVAGPGCRYKLLSAHVHAGARAEAGQRCRQGDPGSL